VIYADDDPRAQVLGGGTIRRIGALQAGAAEAA
jgi:tRNA-specific 2-thiouridylase